MFSKKQATQPIAHLPHAMMSSLNWTATRSNAPGPTTLSSKLAAMLENQRGTRKHFSITTFHVESGSREYANNCTHMAHGQRKKFNKIKMFVPCLSHEAIENKVNRFRACGEASARNFAF